MISFTKAVRNFYVNAFKFKGRATRAEFWWAFLYLALLWTTLLAICFSMGDPGLVIFLLLIVLHIGPIFSLTVRRCHDVNEPGLAALSVLFPFLILFVNHSFLWDPSSEDNEYGPKVTYDKKEECKTKTN